MLGLLAAALGAAACARATEVEVDHSGGSFGLLRRRHLLVATDAPTGVPTSVPSSVPTSPPSTSPSRQPTQMPSSLPTSWPSPVPTMTPAPSTQTVSWTQIGEESVDDRGNPYYHLFTYTNNTISWFFTTYAALWETDEWAESLHNVTGGGSRTEFSFLIDLVVVHKESGVMVDIMEQNFRMDSPYYTRTYHPAAKNIEDFLAGTYNLVIYEYNVGFDSVSPDVVITETTPPSAAPSSSPSLLPAPIPSAAPTGVPTSTPTSETLFVEILDHTRQNHTLGLGSGDVLKWGSHIEMSVAFTGSLSDSRSASVTVRLCRGFGDADDPCGTLVRPWPSACP